MSLKTIYSNSGYGFNVVYNNIVKLKSDMITYDLIQWCSKNIKHKWGWYYENGASIDHSKSYMSSAIMTFEDDKDALWFSLSRDLK